MVVADAVGMVMPVMVSVIVTMGMVMALRPGGRALRDPVVRVAAVVVSMPMPMPMLMRMIMPVVVPMPMLVAVMIVVLAHASFPLVGSAICSSMSPSTPLMWASAAE